jgi:DNA-binding response OmpR family regulator
MAALCLILSDDLLDSSRIAGHAKAAGFDVVTCRDSAALRATLARRPALALIDLHNPGLVIESVAPALQAAGVRAVGFGSHIDVARLKAARAAGCDEVTLELRLAGRSESGGL